VFKWRKKREQPAAQFRVQPEGDFAKIELLSAGESVPASDWAALKSEASMALAELQALDEKLQDEGAQGLTFGSAHILLPADAVARIDANSAEALGFPAPTALALDLKPVHRIDEDSFHIARSWVQPGGYATMIRQHGALIQSDMGLRRIPEPLWSLYKAAGELAAPLPKEERFQALANLKRAWPTDAELPVETDGYLKDLRVHYASGVSLKLRKLAPDETAFDPVLFSASSMNVADDAGPLDEDADSILTESAQHLFAQDRFRRADRARQVYVLQGGEYVFIDPSLQPALDVVRQLQDAPEEQRRQFVLNPRRILRERLGAQTADAIGLDRVFVETEQFSARVAGVDVWRASVLPWLVPSETNQWLPEKFGLRIGEAYYGITTKDLPRLIVQADKAQSEGLDRIPVEGLLTPVSPDTPDHPGYISRTDQAMAAIDALRPFAGPKEEQGNPARDDRAEPQPTQQKLFLVVKDNFEQVGYAAITGDHEAAGQPISIAPPTRLRTSLKPHQVDGLNWLANACRAGLPGVLLADDMGLGKTLQAIAFLAWLQEQAQAQNVERAPCLIVAPTGLLGTWKQEIEKHLNTPGLGMLVPAFGGSLKQLREMDSLTARDIETGRAALDAEVWRDAGLVLTTYETMRDYHFSFAKTRFSAIIYDEIQKLKNPTSQVTRAAQSLNSQFVLGMTGTPVENRLQDLWSIMDVIAPGTLGSSRDFEARHPVTDRAALQRLKDRLTKPFEGRPPLLLRRMKQDILEGLPKKTIKPLEMDMPPLQANAYRDLVMQAATSSAAGTIGQGGILSTLASMRGISLHPIHPAQAPADLDAYAKDSARLSQTLHLLEKIAAAGEKALIFLEDLAMQERLAVLIQARFNLPHLPARISGEVPGIKRQKIVDTFQARPGQFDVMILSPKAGGVGLTLTAANHVIHLSRWWNPAVEDQATDRVFRIGQEKDVFVYLPMAVHPDPAIRASSFDLQLHTLIDRKRALSQDLFFPSDPSDGDLKDLFNHVALVVEIEEPVAAPAPAPIALLPFPIVPPERRKKLTISPVAREYGAKIWRRGSGEPRPIDEIASIFRGSAIARLTIKDPYCLGSSRARAAQIDFVRHLAEKAQVVSELSIHYSADVEGDCSDVDQRQDITKRLQSAFSQRAPRLSLVRHNPRQNRGEDFHDRIVEVHAGPAGAAPQLFTLQFGRGVEALFDLRKECNVCFFPPSA
jgi:superfamily II DNA or RNA helicase